MNCTGKINQGVYNCYGIYDDSLCCECKYNSESDGKEKEDNFVSIKDKMQVFFEYLQGIKLPDGTHCKMPKLSAKKAFSVIWFLQEVMHVLPDNIEQCKDCLGLFDTDREGYHLDDQYSLNGRTLPKKYWGNFCDYCVPCVDFELE